MGIDADCANWCDIDNGSYVTVNVTGAVSVEETFVNSDVFCLFSGGLNDLDAADAGFNNGNEVDPVTGDLGPFVNACRCYPEIDGYLAGCSQCSGFVSFSVKSCINTSQYEEPV